MDADALIADLDGTVWDSRPWYTSLISHLSGRSQAVVLKMVETYSIPIVVDRTPGVSRSKFQHAMAEHIGSLRIYESVESTLGELNRSSVFVAAATSLPGWIADRMLALTGLGAFFQAVSHASKPPTKPSGAVISELLTHCGQEVAPQRVLVVGDDQRDADLAANFGCGFVWAAYGYGQRPKGPKYSVIRRFDDLLL